MKTETNLKYASLPVSFCGATSRTTADDKSSAETAVTSHRTPNILRAVDADGIATLTFDRPDSSANLFDLATLRELDEHLDALEGEPHLRGLILASAKQNIFIAGADLHALAGRAEQRAAGLQPAAEAQTTETIPKNPAASATDTPCQLQTGSTLLELIQLGQSVFSRLAALPVPKVAAIHGACVGGGFELSLACDHRVASDARATKIGLPEIKLGIIPAWGGCTRLPRLVGLPKALDVILAGRVLSAARALKLGLVDALVPREQLLQIAHERVLHPPQTPRPHLRIANNAVSALLIRTRAARELAVKTRGNYPAPFEALDVATYGITLPLEESLELEREAVLRLAEGDVSQNLLRLFLMREGAKKSPAKPHEHITHAAVIGAGIMGAGIAQCLSSHGQSVILRDVSLDQLVRGMATVARLYEEAVQHHQLTPLEARDGLDRVFSAATDVPLREVELVVEAAPEMLPLKRDIFRCLAAQTSPRTILATNTSALSVTEIASATNSPERVIGLHFFNPVPRMELVEVVVGARTSPEVVQRAVQFARDIGKIPVVVQDRPGFVVNRILMPYLVEAVRLFDRGASTHDLDEAMLDFGMPMGPLRLLDEVGFDVATQVVKTLERHFPERVSGGALLDEMIASGLLGRKTGHGFYDYSHDKPSPAAEAMRSAPHHADFTRDELAHRLSLLMVNEAARCVEEQVAASPTDIDLAMVLGAGFAPFRGGPLRYADALGLPNLVADLNKLAEHDARFRPCELLQRMAKENRRFYAEGGAI